jgi:assimilatory nitrate reductase catalytic subunit
MKGFIGSANIDTNSRLCMASAVAAHVLAFGEDLVPGCYEDVDLAELVVFAGHNAAFTHPVLFGRAERAKARGQRHVVIDPRRTDTAEGADLHLPIRPQTDVRLWNGLLAELVRRGAVDRRFLSQHVAGYADVLHALVEDDQSPSAVAADCGLELQDLARFYDLFAAAPRTVSLFCMGVNQSAQGVDKALAIINAHLATGRIGKPGAAPFSMTGQPNAMGGREVGGMASTLAAHMDFDAASRARLGRFWGAPAVAERPGLKAVELFEAMEAGRIKAVWIMGSNPAVSLPDSGAARRALARCPFVVVSDCIDRTDTTAFAQVRLPALAWPEKDGVVTNSERRLSRQRAALPAPGEARADWRIIADVATAMGHGEAFDWRSPAAVFREWARLTAYENHGARVLDLGPLAGLTPDGYEALEPVQWPIRPNGAGARLFGDGRFPTPDGRARMHPVRPQPPAEPVDGGFPLALNTGRVRDQWHTMTRTGMAPELCRHEPEPFVEVHPDDAAAAGIRDGTLTRVITRKAAAVAVARVTDRQSRGSVFMPMHWTDAFAPSGRVNAATLPHVDPRSGQPEFKHAPARLKPYGETWRGFLLARESWTCPPGLELIWRRTPLKGCMLHQFAGRGDAHEREALHRVVARRAPAEEALDYEDAVVGSSRRAWLSGGRLDRALFMTCGPRLPGADWLASLFAMDVLDAKARQWLLAGRPPGVSVDDSPLVCACMGVTEGRILKAAAEGACDVDAVGRATEAGTNCGACRPEIARLVRPPAETKPREIAHVP